MKLKMVLFHYAPVLFFFSILFNHTFAQQQGSREDVTIIKIKENFYRIECINDFGVNVLAFCGDDGLLLVDTGFEQTVKTLSEVLKTSFNKNIKYIINSHHHFDHTGGNTFLGNNNTIVAHVNTYKRLVKAVIYQ